MDKKGSALLIALLIIATLGAVALIMARSVISGVQITANISDGIVAEQASFAGMEYALMQYKNNSGYTTPTACSPPTLRCDIASSSCACIGAVTLLPTVRYADITVWNDATYKHFESVGRFGRVAKKTTKLIPLAAPPETRCDPATEQCVVGGSSIACSSPLQCTILPTTRCDPATKKCVVGGSDELCEDDIQCGSSPPPTSYCAADNTCSASSGTITCTTGAQCLPTPSQCNCSQYKVAQGCQEHSNCCWWFSNPDPPASAACMSKGCTSGTADCLTCSGCLTNFCQCGMWNGNQTRCEGHSSCCSWSSSDSICYNKNCTNGSGDCQTCSECQ